MRAWAMFILTAMTLVFFSCSGKNLKQVNREPLEIFVFQSGQEVPIHDDTVEIKKNFFSVVIVFNSPDAVLVNASFESETFDALDSQEPMNKIPGFSNTPIAEELFNKDEVLYISNHTPGIWYYTDDADNRFNEIDKINSGFYCRRNIKKIINLDENNSETNIMDITQNTIYMGFIKTRWSEDFTTEIEISRRKLKIVFSI